MTIQKTDNQAKQLLASALTLTATYQDLGVLINTMDCESIALWIKLDINSSTGFTVRMVAAQTETATDFYTPPIKDVAASLVSVQPSETKFTNNVDQNIVITFPTSDQLPFVKFQVKVDVVGAPAGQVLAAGVTFTSNLAGG